jgi:hypothetical protein
MTASPALTKVLADAGALWCDGLANHVAEAIGADAKTKKKIVAAVNSYNGTPVHVAKSKKPTPVVENLGEKKIVTIVENYSAKSHAIFGAPTKDIKDKLSALNKNTLGKDGKTAKVINFKEHLAFGAGWVTANDAHKDATIKSVKKILDKEKIRVEVVEASELLEKAKAKASKTPKAAAGDDDESSDAASGSDADATTAASDASSSDAVSASEASASSKASTASKAPTKGKGCQKKAAAAAAKADEASTKSKGGKKDAKEDKKGDKAAAKEAKKAAKAEKKDKKEEKKDAKADSKGAKDESDSRKLVKNEWGNEVLTKADKTTLTNMVGRKLPVGVSGKELLVVIGKQDPEAKTSKKGLESVHVLSPEDRNTLVERGLKPLTDEVMATLKKSAPKVHAELLKWSSAQTTADGSDSDSQANGEDDASGSDSSK